MCPNFSLVHPFGLKTTKKQKHNTSVILHISCDAKRFQIIFDPTGFHTLHTTAFWKHTKRTDVEVRQAGRAEHRSPSPGQARISLAKFPSIALLLSFWPLPPEERPGCDSASLQLLPTTPSTSLGFYRCPARLSRLSLSGAFRPTTPCCRPHLTSDSPSRCCTLK